MRMLPVAAVLLAALSSCAPQPPVADAAAPMAAATDCIDQQFIIGKHPDGDHAMIFEMSGGVTYRNELLSSCPNLGRYAAGDSYVFDIKGGRLCRNDEFRVFDPVEAKAVGTRAFPTCRLGSFVRIPNP